MAAFTYDAINAQGIELSGEIHAPDLAAAREQLQTRGLLPQSLSERSASGERGARTAFKKVKAKNLQVFSRQLATMIEAGVSIVAALVTLEEQTEDKYLREVIAEIRSDVEGGMVLSKAFARHPKVFNRLYVSMIEAGESSGTLDKVLDRAATQIEKDNKLRRRVKGAMVYPAVVITFASLVLTFMLMFIVPVFAQIFEDLNGELPKPTQFVMGMSNLLRGWWFIIFPLIIGLIFAFRRWKQTESGRQLWDRFKLKIPMKIGAVVHKVALARVSRTLATLIAAGVDIIKALEITGATAGSGDPVFPAMVGHMVKVGDETGELDKMLGKVADFYEDEVDTAIQSLTSIIEPLLMIGVGAMVGLIVISMYMPMFKMLTLIK